MGKRTPLPKVREHGRGLVTFCVDVGGSNIKSMPLDADGHPLAHRIKVPTPRPATPQTVMNMILALAREAGEFDRVSVGFPGVVRHGRTITAVNLDGKWNGFDLQTRLGRSLKKPVHVMNDAAIQGYGAITGKGVELVITLGTGFGSSLFVDGHVIPLEMGHHAFRKGETYEEQLGNKTLEKVGMRRWRRRLKLAIEQLQRAFWFDHLWIGGGNARLIDWKLPPHVTTVSNLAGILGGIALWRHVGTNHT